MKRLLAASLSAVIFTALLCLFMYTPKDQLEPGVSYSGLGELFTVFLISIAPIYLTLRIGMYWTADRYSAASSGNCRHMFRAEPESQGLPKGKGYRSISKHIKKDDHE